MQKRAKIEKTLGDLLKEKHLTMSTAESCTGGGIAAKMTSISGSSEYFIGGIVAYQNEVKEQFLHVRPETIEKFNVVSAETVEEMARGAMKVFKTDCAVATSGIAGPTGGDEERPVGTIWIAAAYHEKVVTMKQEGDNGRARNIQKAIRNALKLLEKLLKG
jgi:PncC family amidohydrolase